MKLFAMNVNVALKQATELAKPLSDALEDLKKAMRALEKEAKDAAERDYQMGKVLEKIDKANTMIADLEEVVFESLHEMYQAYVKGKKKAG